MLCSVKASVKSRQTRNLYCLAVVAVVCAYVRLRDDVYAVVAIKGAVKRLELLLAVVVRGSSHNHHRANSFQLTQEAYRRLLLFQSSVAPNSGLMKDVACNYCNVRLLFLCACYQCVKALADVLKSHVFPAFLRAGEIPDM